MTDARTKDETGVAGRLADAFTSLRLGISLMLALALVCTAATFYESRYGTPAAGRNFYGTWWFSALLALLGINMFASMLKRYPWNRFQVGFVLAHIGVVLLLIGSLVTLNAGLDGSMAVAEKETTDRVSLPDSALQVALPGGEPASFPVDFARTLPAAGRERRFPIGSSGVSLVAEAWEPHVHVHEGLAEGAGGNPALHFSIDGPARQDGWLVAGDAERGHAALGPLALGFERFADEADARKLAATAGDSKLAFGVIPDGTLLYAIVAKSGRGSSGRVEIGKPIRTPWMTLSVTVDQFLPSVVSRRTVEPAAPPEAENRRQPAVRVHLEGPAGRSTSEWLAWTEVRSVAYGGGDALVAYRNPELAVPFRVTLLQFSADKYPGSSMAATYESRVRVDDPERGASEHLISMNHPLHYRGYTLFQSSFVEGQPMTSIFSVSRAPGLPLVYTGTALATLGIVWMFYVKPWLARRQARKALAARRAEALAPAPARAEPQAELV